MAYSASGTISYRGHCTASFDTQDARFTKGTTYNVCKNACKYTWYGKTSDDPNKRPSYNDSTPPAFYSGIYVGGQLKSQGSIPYGYTPWEHKSTIYDKGETFLRMTKAYPNNKDPFGQNTYYISAKGTFGVTK